MTRFLAIAERTAGCFLGALAAITAAEAILRYAFNSHIPDGFVVGQMTQGVAICWGIATATYADRHITVDIVYEFAGAVTRRLFDVIAYTLNLLFLTLFGCAVSFKVYDVLRAGEVSVELGVPLWTGYLLAALGVVIAVAMSAMRWWQAVVLRQAGSPRHD